MKLSENGKQATKRLCKETDIVAQQLLISCRTQTVQELGRALPSKTASSPNKTLVSSCQWPMVFQITFHLRTS